MTALIQMDSALETVPAGYHSLVSELFDKTRPAHSQDGNSHARTRAALSLKLTSGAARSNGIRPKRPYERLQTGMQQYFMQYISLMRPLKGGVDDPQQKHCLPQKLK